MKKNLLLAALSALSVLSLASCGGEKTYEYALVTDVGDINDHSFNQTAWEATKAFAEANKKTVAYYRPTEDSKEARITSIELAISKGAKVVVCPGYLFETALFDIQDTYKDVKFVLLDGTPNNGKYDETAQSKVADNTVSLIYQEQIAGYFAGYAAVADGNTKLGFCGGMAVPAVIRYGYGYLQGIDAAAKKLGKNVEVDYYYAGQFAATDAATALMTSWYAAGTEVVFACGGKVYQSVVAGCGTTHKWIGVDVDQSSEGKEVLTSAMKGLAASVTSALQSYKDGTWSQMGGKTWNLGLQSTLGAVAATDYVGIPTDDASWRFTNFSKADFQALVAAVGDGSSIKSDTTVDPTSFASSNMVVRYAK